MKQKIVKVFAWLMFLIGLVSAGLLIFLWHSTEDGQPIMFEKKEVESVWYSNFPTENKITFYQDGSYSSEHWGSPEGTYVVDQNNRVLTDPYHSEQSVEIRDHVMTIDNHGENILYYDDKDLLPEIHENPEDYELLCKRKTAVTKIMDQAEWKNDQGHQLSGTMTELTLDKKTMPYEVEELEMAATKYDLQMKVGDDSIHMTIDVDINTMEYTLKWNNMTFIADGTNFDLDC